MASITKTHTFSAGAVIVAGEHNTNFDTIYDDYNINITNVNISDSAAIVDTKLTQLKTASKVNLSALVITSQAGGDIIYASSATALARLAAGTSGNYLQSAGTLAPVWASGHVLQIATTLEPAVVTGAGLATTDNTLAQATTAEGFQLMSLAITPAATANKLIITSTAVLSFGSVGGHVVSLYSTPTTGAATADAIATAILNGATGGTQDTISFTHVRDAVVSTPITFSVRAGHTAGAGTAVYTLNGVAGAGKYGGVSASSMEIKETQVNPP